jgi:chaperonin GroES
MKKKAQKKKGKSKLISKSVSKKSGIMPLGDRVLIRPFTEEEAKGEKGNKHFGIILPDTDKKEKSSQGKVLAAGESKKVKTGDVVVFSKYSYDEVEYGGEELYLIKEENILAVIN